MLSGNTLYGTTVNGGTYGYGTVFKVNTDGTGFSVLKSFANSPDGSNPYGQLILLGNTLYGTTELGGSSNDGTVYQINTDGNGYQILKHFQGGADGSLPYGGLVTDTHALYGTAQSGGGGYGTIYKIDLTVLSPPYLTIQRAGQNAILSWTNAGFNLQQATNVAGPFVTIEGAASPYTDALTGGARFFRLIGN